MKHKLWKLFVFLCAVSLIVFLLWLAGQIMIQKTYAVVGTAPDPMPVSSLHSAPVATIDPEWQGYTLLKHIASCESWGDPNKEPRQFLPDGSLLQGFPNPDDIGLAQINVPIWYDKAKSMGWDIYNFQGNLAMAKWLFNTYGSAPWIYSKGCWGQYQ